MFPLTDLGTIAGVAVLVTVLVQLIKPLLPNDKYVPLLAVALGTCLALLGSWAIDVVGKRELVEAVITGILGGASSIGLYEVQKPINVLKAK